MPNESLIEPFVEGKFYGGYWPGGTTELAYRAVMVDRAIRTDDWPRLNECIANGWITSESRTFDNSLVVDYCLFREARTCALELRALGWPEWHRP